MELHIIQEIILLELDIIILVLGIIIQELDIIIIQELNTFNFIIKQLVNKFNINFIVMELKTLIVSISPCLEVKFKLKLVLNSFIVIPFMDFIIEFIINFLIIE
jgi:hypothetical protein